MGANSLEAKPLPTLKITEFSEYTWNMITTLHHYWEFCTSLSEVFLRAMPEGHLGACCTSYVTILENFQSSNLMRKGARSQPKTSSWLALSCRIGENPKKDATGYLVIEFMFVQKLVALLYHFWCFLQSYNPPKWLVKSLNKNKSYRKWGYPLPPLTDFLWLMFLNPSLNHELLTVWDIIQYNTVVWYSGKENEQNLIELDKVNCAKLWEVLWSLNRGHFTLHDVLMMRWWCADDALMMRW